MTFGNPDSGLRYPERRLRFGSKRRVPIVLARTRDAEQTACLVMLAQYYGLDVDLDSVIRRVAPDCGDSIKMIMEAAAVLGLDARLVTLKHSELGRMHLPALLLWQDGRLVVMERSLLRGGAVVVDPAIGEVRLTVQTLKASFRGSALEVVPRMHFPAPPKRTIRLRELIGKVIGLRRSILQVFLLAISMELFTLIAPFYMQLVVDGAIASADNRLLVALAIGFSLLLIIQVAIGAIRSYAVLYMGTHLNLQLVTNLFAHLIRLPLSFFEKRQLGGIAAQFASVGVIQRTLTTKLVEAIMDGALAIATVTMMALYSVGMSIVVITSVGIYALLRWAAFHPFRRICEKQIALLAKEQSLLLESVRAIQAIKIFNHEEQRKTRWRDALVESTNSAISNETMELGFITSHKLLAGLENIVVVWLGATLVMKNSLSLGMLFAFMSFKTTFVFRTHALINKWSDLQLLSVQANHLADIALTPGEATEAEYIGSGDSEIANVCTARTFAHKANPQSSGLVLPECPPIEVRDISFRYTDADPWVLRHLSLSVGTGESVTLVGTSGSGKTTLVKVLLGLLVPEEGAVLIDGVSIWNIGLQTYRSWIGAVMQEDSLLRGTIMENITFFDRRADIAWAKECSRAAAITPDIAAMPKGYNTLIGDMGVSISGGQKQRLLVARALYRRPKLLLLDEASSHLDLAKEQEVNLAIDALGVTKIIVAHRPETIRMARRVVEIGNGRVVRDSARSAASALEKGSGGSTRSGPGPTAVIG